MNQKKIIFIFGSVLFLCLSGILYFFVQNEPVKEEWQSVDSVSSEIACSETMTASVPKTKEEIERIKVYICGAVKTPGVYEVSTDDRLVDLLDLCGGFSEDADSNAVNLAEYLEDGEKIYIMTKDETSKDFIEAEEDTDGRVNINTATQDELMTLPGIGKAKAERIIAYREQTTRFESIDDIMKIDGIKQGVYEKIKDYIKI